MMQTTAKPRTRTAKAGPPAVVRWVDLNSGLYRVLSSNGVDWYRVNAVEGTCTCKAFIDFGKVCRHVRAATATWNMHRSLRLGRAPMVHVSGAEPVVAAVVSPRAAFRHCAGCGADYFGLLVDGWCSCSQRAPISINRGRDGAAALRDAFGM